MRFQVPQFLEIEDKIFGPFTFREFIYLAGGAGLCFILYKLFGFVVGFIPIALVAALSLTLTFYKPNGKPFIFMIEAFFNYLTKAKLYIWSRDGNTGGEIRKKLTEKQEIRKDLENKVRLGGDKLKDLAWSLDILDLKK